MNGTGPFSEKHTASVRKVRFSKDFMLIKNIINFYNLITYLFFYTLSNYFSPTKHNQFKYL